MGVRRIDPLIGGEKDMTEYASRQFSAIYERYRVVVYYTALRVTRSKEAAEDVMQSVFLELMDNCERTGRIPDEVGGWLVKLAKYRSLDHVRSESRTVPTEAPEVHAGDAGAAAENNVVIRSALETLSDEEREIFDLKVLGGFKHREIAKILSSNPSTVRWQYAQIVKKLKPLLADLN